ncbi:MAG: hypothetical protein EBR01_12500 [Proteobacteria bacterium]|nr:hypothetical protein [Pseudomonadota bacterium]
MKSKLNTFFIAFAGLFFWTVNSRAETLVPVSRVTQVARTSAVPAATHSPVATNNLQPVYPSPYPYPYPYYGAPRFSSFSFGLSIGGFGGGRPFFGRCGRRALVRRCARPVARCRARRRCY